MWEGLKKATSMIWEVVTTLLVLLILYAFSHVLQAIVFYYKICKAVKSIPGLPTHWLYGNLHQKARTDSYDVEMYEWVKKNNIAVSKEWLGPFNVVINIHDPDVMKTVIKAPKATFFYQLFAPWLGQGLLISSGKRWARNRRLLTKAFHFDILKPYVETYNDAVNELITNWRDHVNKAPNTPLPVYKSVSCLTLDILLRCSFSYKSNCQIDDSSSPYINAVFSLTRIILDRFFSLPLMLLNDTLYLNCTRQGRQFKQACDVVHGHAEKVIQERKKVLSLNDSKDPINMEDVFSRAKRNHKCLDFLDILLTARDDSGKGLSDTEIRYEVDTFMFEGFDTTAHGLCWTLYCLAKFPEHQDKCREEVNKVLGSRESVEFEDLAKLSYMHCCIKEAFRLFPPVYVVMRQLDEDSQVGDYSLPKGTFLNLRFYNLHRSSKHWEDSEMYKPDRFSSNEVKNQNPFAYVPFSAGPRNCIGQNFAMNEERVVLARIIKQFKFRLADGYEVDKLFGVLLHMRNDVKLIIEPI